jgi:hypothetical protein
MVAGHRGGRRRPMPPLGALNGLHLERKKQRTQSFGRLGACAFKMPEGARADAPSPRSDGRVDRRGTPQRSVATASGCAPSAVKRGRGGTYFAFAGTNTGKSAKIKVSWRRKELRNCLHSWKPLSNVSACRSLKQFANDDASWQHLEGFVGRMVPCVSNAQHWPNDGLWSQALSPVQSLQRQIHGRIWDAARRHASADSRRSTCSPLPARDFPVSCWAPSSRLSKEACRHKSATARVARREGRNVRGRRSCAPRMCDAGRCSQSGSSNRRGGDDQIGGDEK